MMLKDLFLPEYVHYEDSIDDLDSPKYMLVPQRVLTYLHSKKELSYEIIANYRKLKLINVRRK